MLLLILGALILIGIIYYKYVIPLRYWKDRGVAQGKPIPIFGHFFENFFGKMNFAMFCKKYTAKVRTQGHIYYWNKKSQSKIMLVILGVAVLIGFFYYKCVMPLSYWKKRGVEQGNPKLIFGHFFEAFIGKIGGVEFYQRVYEQSPNARYTGIYQFSNPVLFLRDPELIQQITIKDFESFADHDLLTVPEGADPLWTKNLLTLKGSQWKEMRMILSPSFTGSKMRLMFGLIKECSDSLVQHLLNKDREVVTVEIKDLFSRYTNDVIATTAFGIKVDSLDQPDNKFYAMGKDLVDFGFAKVTRVFLYQMLPAIKYLLKIQIFSDEASSYFRRIIDDAIAARVEQGVVRPDMLHLLLQARSTQGKKNNSTPRLELTNEDITAQAIIFFNAGFETVSSLLTFTAYELALNQDIQERLREEVKSTLEECGGDVTYDTILKLKYMDMVISESLRKWPNFLTMDRVCTKSHTIEPSIPGEKPVYIEKGTKVLTPIYTIQHDPKYFPNPEKFDPERFSEENKEKGQLLTFGLGPRICIGSRFAILEAKLLLFQILANFEIVPVKETTIPLKLSKDLFVLRLGADGLLLGLKKSKV